MRGGALIIGMIVVFACLYYFMNAGGAITSARIHIIEKWYVVEDTGFTREFFADGKVTDSRGNKSDTRNWALFTKEMPVDGVPHILETGVHYLSIAAPKGDVAYFKIISLDSRSMTLQDLATGGMRTFKVAP